MLRDDPVLRSIAKWVSVLLIVCVVVIALGLLSSCDSGGPCQSKVVLLGYSGARNASWTQCDSRARAQTTIMPSGEHVLVECRCSVLVEAP